MSEVSISAIGACSLNIFSVYDVMKYYYSDFGFLERRESSVCLNARGDEAIQSLTLTHSSATTVSVHQKCEVSTTVKPCFCMPTVRLVRINILKERDTGQIRSLCLLPQAVCSAMYFLVFAVKSDYNGDANFHTTFP